MDEKGVSPVIGVILMVAITVLLAAIIASYIFSFGSNVPRTYSVSFTADQYAPDEVYITFRGGSDAEFVEECVVVGKDVSFDKEEIGVAKKVDVTQGEILNIKCEFADGTEQVVFTYRVK